jgi:transcription-repair coupling factor (superfamily II helicase)
VNIDHGIAKYRGLRHMKVADVQGDFLNLEYAGNDTMYVPVERINLVQRYIGGDNAEPKLDKLGSGSWEKVSGARGRRCSRWRPSCSTSTRRAR